MFSTGSERARVLICRGCQELLGALGVLTRQEHTLLLARTTRLQARNMDAVASVHAFACAFACAWVKKRERVTSCQAVSWRPVRGIILSEGFIMPLVGCHSRHVPGPASVAADALSEGATLIETKSRNSRRTLSHVKSQGPRSTSPSCSTAFKVAGATLSNQTVCPKWAGCHRWSRRSAVSTK